MKFSTHISRLILSLAMGAMLHFDFAFAAEDELGICPSVEDVDNEIISCGSNAYVGQKAKQCSDAIIASWKTASAALKVQLAANAAVDSQNVSEEKTFRDYDQTIRSLDKQIAYMVENTSLIVSYTERMVDFPEGVDDATSAQCFNDPFHEISDLVWNLDEEIIRAKKIRQMAVDMRATAHTRHKNFDRSIFEGLMSEKTVAAGRGHSVNGKSDVTGLANDRAKRRSLSVEKGKGGVKKVAAPSALAANANTSFAFTGKREFSAKSDITKSSKAEAPGWSPESIVEDSFHGKLSEEEAVAPQEKSKTGKTAAAEYESVGEVLWTESAKDVQANLSVGESTAFTGEVGPALPTALSRRPAAEGTLVVASSEKDLFQLVSTRYRQSELFRSVR
ncbi:MAG TPA: hypothetical protein VIH99_11530 [Bdellovibrionota bacterium]|jgi:hypothetical protein